MRRLVKLAFPLEAEAVKFRKKVSEYYGEIKEEAGANETIADGIFAGERTVHGILVGSRLAEKIEQLYKDNKHSFVGDQNDVKKNHWAKIIADKLSDSSIDTVSQGMWGGNQTLKSKIVRLGQAITYIFGGDTYVHALISNYTKGPDYKKNKTKIGNLLEGVKEDLRNSFDINDINSSTASDSTKNYKNPIKATNNQSNTIKIRDFNPDELETLPPSYTSVSSNDRLSTNNKSNSNPYRNS